VQNPVTAVLLNFRSYDTLLEIAVLLIVAMAMLPDRTVIDQPLLTTNHTLIINPMLANLVHWLVPLAVLTGGYLLWIGAYEPGGAFQAGAVLAAAGVALSLAGHHHFIWNSTVARLILTLGLLVFTIAAVMTIAITGTVLQYPVAAAGTIILLIETAATLSIAAILLLLYTRLAEGHSSYLRNTP
jgi:multisubunit Na+/H+ antiporter MnhB subunit